jgi:hypothetical protein
MTQYILCNDVSMSQGGQVSRLTAGKLVDTANQNVAAILGAGGVLVAANASAIAQATLLTKYRRYKGQGLLLDVAREIVAIQPPQGAGALASAWTATITAALNPFQTLAIQPSVAFDTLAAGLVIIKTPLAPDGVSLPQDQQGFLTKPVTAGVAGAQVQASGAGVTIEVPGAPGTFAAVVNLLGQGGGIAWKYRANDKKWIGVSGF